MAKAKTAVEILDAMSHALAKAVGSEADSFAFMVALCDQRDMNSYVRTNLPKKELARFVDKVILDSIDKNFGREIRYEEEEELS